MIARRPFRAFLKGSTRTRLPIVTNTLPGTVADALAKRTLPEKPAIKNADFFGIFTGCSNQPSMLAEDYFSPIRDILDCRGPLQPTYSYSDICRLKTFVEMKVKDGVSRLMPPSSMEDMKRIAPMMGVERFYERHSRGIPQPVQIGSGSFSIVYKGRDPGTGKIVAVKYLTPFHIDSAEVEIQKIISELAIMLYFYGQPHVAGALGYYVDTATDGYGNLVFHICIVQDLAVSSLESFMKNQPVMSPRLFIKLMRGMLNGLQLLKHERIIHNDVKPENVLVFKDALGNLHTQVADFGLSNIVHSSDDVVDGRCGTLKYSNNWEFGSASRDGFSFGLSLLTCFYSMREWHNMTEQMLENFGYQLLSVAQGAMGTQGCCVLERGCQVLSVAQKVAMGKQGCLVLEGGCQLLSVAQGGAMGTQDCLLLQGVSKSDRCSLETLHSMLNSVEVNLIEQSVCRGETLQVELVGASLRLARVEGENLRVALVEKEGLKAALLEETQKVALLEETQKVALLEETQKVALMQEKLRRALLEKESMRIALVEAETLRLARVEAESRRDAVLEVIQEVALMQETQKAALLQETLRRAWVEAESLKAADALLNAQLQDAVAYLLNEPRATPLVSQAPPTAPATRAPKPAAGAGVQPTLMSRGYTETQLGCFDQGIWGSVPVATPLVSQAPPVAQAKPIPLVSQAPPVAQAKPAPLVSQAPPAAQAKPTSTAWLAAGAWIKQAVMTMEDTDTHLNLCDQGIWGPVLYKPLPREEIQAPPTDPATCPAMPLELVVWGLPVSQHLPCPAKPAADALAQPAVMDQEEGHVDELIIWGVPVS
eukprot:gene18866-25422_t